MLVYAWNTLLPLLFNLIFVTNFEYYFADKSVVPTNVDKDNDKGIKEIKQLEQEYSKTLEDSEKAIDTAIEELHEVKFCKCLELSS